MQKILAIAALFFLSISSNAQSNDLPELVLGFTNPEVKGFTDDQTTLLRSKALEAMSAGQVGVYDYSLNFYLQPDFAVVSRKVSEGGLRKIYIVNAKLILSVKNAMNQQILSASSIPLQGSGISEEEALSNAINAIEPDASSMQDFLTKTKEKIGQYYSSQCSVLSNEFDVLLAKKQYESVLVRMATIPSGNKECLNKLKNVRAKALKLYEQQMKASQAASRKPVIKERSKVEAGKAKEPGTGAAAKISNASNTGNLQNAFSNISNTSSGPISGSDDPVASIAAAILATRQVKS